MKRTSLIITITSAAFLILFTGLAIHTGYKGKKDVFSYWSLSEKSSTIEKKAKYMDKFVEAIEKQGWDGQYNALFQTTPNNSYELNLEALKSLQQRLHEIEFMDVKSFEYQTAIQQITAQEQGESEEMLDVFHGLYFKNNCVILWGAIGWWIVGITTLLFMTFGITFLFYIDL